VKGPDPESAGGIKGNQGAAVRQNKTHANRHNII